MAHPYNAAIHQHRNNNQTPSSSMSQLSIDQSHLLPQSFAAQTSFESNATGASSSATGILPIGPAVPGSAGATTSTGPQRRRRRSLRGVPKPAGRKKSADVAAKAVSSILEDPSAKSNEPHVPTRNYQFKAFESFDPTPSRVATAIPLGAEYTFGPPQQLTSPSQTPPSTTSVSDNPTPSLTDQQQPKKSKALLTVGKRVVKEVLGGGGNYAPPPEAKAVYYGRGGAGGVGPRPNKPHTSSFPGSPGLPNGQPVGKPAVEPHRSGSYYTGSSAYTPSVVSSPCAESMASSPYATSVEDGSLYAPSCHSAPHTVSSLRASLSRPSPSYRSVSPAAFSDSRRHSLASSYPGTLSTSDGDDAFDGSLVGDGYWSSPCTGAARRQSTPLLVEDGMPGDGTGESVGYSMPGTPYTRMGSGQDDVGAGSSQQIHHHPSRPSMLSYSSATNNSPTVYSTPESAQSLFASPYLAPVGPAIRSSDTAISSTIPSRHRQVHRAPSVPRYQAATSTTSSLMGAVSDPRGQPDFQSRPDTGAPPSLPMQPQLPVTPSPQWPNMVTPAATTTSRPLPDPLAQAVEQLSLIKNPLNMGWPLPQNSQSYYGPNPQQRSGSLPASHDSYTASSSIEAFNSNVGASTPNYLTRAVGHPSSSFSAPPRFSVIGENFAYQQALAEQQALARALAELEELQQQNTGMAFQDGYPNGGGRTM